MAWIHVRHPVADYEKWKAVYDETATFKRGMGWKRHQLFAVGGDRHDVLVMEEFGTMAQARAFLDAPDLRAAMERAGISGPPEILLVESLEEGNA